MADLKSLGKLTADEQEYLDGLAGASSLVVDMAHPQWLRDEEGKPVLDEAGARVRHPDFAKLVPLSDEDKVQRLLDYRAHQTKAAQAVQAAAARQGALDKLKALGLDDGDLKALGLGG